MVCYFHEDWYAMNKKEIIFSQDSYSLTELFSDLLRSKKKWPYKTGDLLKEVQFI
jgi:hypothetical protein